LAETIIRPTQSCRTDVLNPDTNRHDSSKLSVRSDASSAKSWIKFDLGDLDAADLQTATLTLALHEGKTGARQFDVSYVNDDCRDNIDWDERTLTWTNAPGNSATDFGGLDKAKTTLVSTVHFTDGVAGDAFTIDVLAALETDTDGIVQFVIHNSNGLLNLATHDHAQEGYRPFLDVTAGPVTQAKKPRPADGETDVVREAVLSWRPGRYAAAHDVYLGTVLEDVNTADRTDTKGVLASRGQTAAAFDPEGLLAFGQTCYWRVDEVNAPPTSTIYRGAVWSFETEPYAYAVQPIAATASSSHGAVNPADSMGPEKTIDGSGLDAEDGHSTAEAHMWLTSAADPGPAWIQYEFDGLVKLHEMWVWNSNQAIEALIGAGAREVVIETSTDGTSWTALGGVWEFAQATGEPGYAHNTTVALGGVVTRFVRLTIQRNWSTLGLTQCGLSEVRFFQIPMRARQPLPEPGAVAVALDATLTWRPGREAVRHEIWFGTDPNALVLAQTVTGPEVALASLGAGYGRTYYWRVDEVNEAASPTSWQGQVWSFSTPAYKAVDDFEGYTDASPNRIFQAWIDGMGFSADEFFPAGNSGNGTGALVGNPNPPYAERTIVHSGAQSMPLAYNGLSEATRTFAPAQDWTRAGLKTLSIAFRGAADNTGQLYVKVNNTRIDYTLDATHIATAEWQVWNIDLSAVQGNLQGVTTLTVGIAGGSGTIYVDDIGLYP